MRLLHGLNKNQFFHCFGLLHDLLRRQDLPNKSFDRRLKRSTMFLSISVKDISPGWFYCPDSQGNFEMTLFVCLFSAAFIANSKSDRSGTAHSRKLERSFVEISSAILENLSKLLYSIDFNIAMKSEMKCMKT